MIKFRSRILMAAVLTSLFAVVKAQKLPYQNPQLPVEQRVSDLVARMTRLEKIRQLDMYRGWSVSPMGDSHEATILSLDSLRKVFKKGSIGSVHDFYPVSAQLSNRLQHYAITHTRLGIPVMFIEEGLHGYSGKGSTSFPIPLALAATWDTLGVYEVGRAIATESRAHGTHMILGPLLGVARDPRWGRMEETFGEDTHLVTAIGLGMVKGLQGGDVSRQDAVVSEPKHFAAHSAPEAGSNTAPVDMGERAIRTVYLPSFKKAVMEGGALGIMAAYHELDGIPSVDNSWLLRDILRKEWGFKGMVVSDLGAIKMSLETHHIAKDRASALAQSLKAGLNMQFYDFEHADFEAAVDSAVSNGLLSAAALDSAVSDVLRVKMLLGLFDHPYVDTSLLAKVGHSKAHQALALQVASQSAVLLKNKNGVLPILPKEGTKTRLALIGPLATSSYLGGYSNPEDTAVSLLTGLRSRMSAPLYKNKLTLSYLPGLADKKKVGAALEAADSVALAEAVSLARKADVLILALGEDPEEVGEGRDRAALQLPLRQLRLLRALRSIGKPVVAVLYNGRPLCLTELDTSATAILEGWFGGETSGLALADILLGRVNPSGRLPVSFPRSVGQIPIYYAHKPSSLHRYVDEKDSPLYPFGFGLSYTSFEYSDLKLPRTRLGVNDTLEVRMVLKNTGQLAGAEVVQLYIRDEVSSVTTPVKALKAFSRTALGAGDSKELVFRLPVQEALGLWNKDMQYVVEPGSFDIMVGSSCQDIHLRATFEVQ